MSDDLEHTAAGTVTAARTYNHIAARVFDTPLLIEASKLNAILHVLGPRLGFDVAPIQVDAVEYDEAKAHASALQRWSYERADAGYYIVEGGVAVVPILGTLVQRSGWLDSFSGLTSYERVERMFMDSMDNKQVKEVILEIDSPGGEVAGAFDLADRMSDLRGAKPTTAIATEFSASAAYLLASPADEIVVPRTGMVGSIGVVMAHYDWSKALEKRGVAVTLIYAGDHKVDGNPFEPLPENVRGDLQREVDSLYRLFTSTVATNRAMEEAAVRKTQAAMFMGVNATKVGLADRVGTFVDEVGAAVERVASSKSSTFIIGSTKRKEKHMSTRAKKAEDDEEDKKDNQKESRRAEDDEEDEKEQKRGKRSRSEDDEEDKKDSDSKKAERDRVKGIVMSDEAKDRQELAAHLAFDTDLSIDSAKAILAKSGKETSGSPLDAAMRKEVGADATASAVASQEHKPATPKTINAAGIFEARRAAAQSAARSK